MDKKLFKHGLKYKVFLVMLFFGTAVGLLLAFASLGISSTDSEEDIVHSMITAMCSLSSVISAVIISSELFSVAVAYNRSRGAMLKTLSALFAIYSLITSALTLCFEFITAKIFTRDGFIYEFRPMLQNMGFSHADCTGVPGMIFSFLFQFAFFMMLYFGGAFIFGLFKRLPPKAGAVAWIVLILGMNSFTLFGDLIDLEVDLTAALRIGIVGAGLVIFTVLSTYCIKTCSAESRAFGTEKG